jgi:tyrosyl-tRNA synthetase
MTSADQILKPMRRTIDSIVGEEQLRARLESGNRLRIKFGVDCTAPDLHLGHAVNLWLMRHLQEVGHRVVLLLGDLTTRIGDPTGKSETRPVLTAEEIEANAAAFLEQAGLVLRTEPEVFEVRRNSEWFGRMPVVELLNLFSMTTHAHVMSRDMFRERQAAGREIALHELTYPVLQGFDSYAMGSDLTIVGSDQLFNELMGRHYQERLGATAQVVVTTRITPGLDGGPKQSKSLGNYVALTDSPTDKFGKIMSLADALVEEWAIAYTDLPDRAVVLIERAIAEGGTPARDAKLDVAEAVVRRYHGEKEGTVQRSAFLSVFSRGHIPEDVPMLVVEDASMTVRELVRRARPELSGSACLRLVREGAVRMDDQTLADPDAVVDLHAGAILRTGRRNWSRVEISAT